MNFANNLSLLRRRAGYTQEGLAEAMSVSRQAVSKWESGQTLPEAAALPRLADLLGCTLDQLMREELEPEAPPPPEPPTAAMTETLKTPLAAPAVMAEVPETGWKPEDDRAVFERYDKHMNRYAILVALGTGLILAGVGAMLSFAGMGVDNGLMLLPLLVFVGAAVALFIWGGLSHGDFQRRFRVVPDLYTQEDRAQFRRVYRLGMAVSVGSLMLDIGGFVALVTLVEGREALEIWAVALLLLVLAGSVASIVLLAMLEGKYNLDAYAQDAAKIDS